MSRLRLHPPGSPDPMHGVLDLHCHLLAAVDDGPPDLASAQALVAGLRQQGVDCAVATPHLLSPRFAADGLDEAIAAAWPRLQELAAAVGLRVFLGAENHCSGQHDPETFARTARPLGDGPCVLVELPDDHLPGRAWASCFALVRAGRRPVLAHPERCRGLRGDDEGLAAFVAGGGLLQITAGHVAGIHGWSMRWRSRRLLARYPQACVLASDAHDLRARRPAWDRLPEKFRRWICPDLASLATWRGGA